MQVLRKDISDTKVLLTISAAEAYLEPFKLSVLELLRKDVKLQGFRSGNAPLNLVEKNVDPQKLQSAFIDEAMNVLYTDALLEEKLRPIDKPKVTLKKFVPFTNLEFEAEVEVLGQIKLADYKKLKKSVPSVKVTEKDVANVLSNLQTRMAESKDVTRVAKDGDKLVIDFTGVDTKKQPIKGADGKDYPLLLGSDTFIPGFEKNLVGVKPGEDREFTLEFPKSYGVKALAGSKVTFSVTVKKVQEQTLPKLDDAFVKKVGPFKTLSELKADIKKQLLAEKQSKALQDVESEIIKEVAEKSKLTVPQSLVTDQIERLKTELRQNLTYRGLTYDEYLKQESKSEEEYIKTVLTPEAEQRVRAGLVLAEIAEVEGLTVTTDELELRIQMMKGQYQDAAMQGELDKPESRSNIASRMLTEKTIQKLVDYATA